MVLFLASVYKLGRFTSHLDQAHRFELIPDILSVHTRRNKWHRLDK
jgi:hypothetical protein